MVEDRELMKTGTTTLALLCKDGIVLAADKRATSGYLIANKKFDKIISITDDIAVTVAGTVSDVQLLAKYIKAELKLKRIRTDRESTVKEAANLLSMMVYNNIRKLSLIPGISHFIIGGKDEHGFHIYDLSPDGSIAEIDDYNTSGSGSVMVYGVLETLYKKNMSMDEGIKLAAKSINAAVQRDIASGNGINIVTITKDGVKKVLSKDIDTRIEV
ncbi:MAG: proteasome subunit beta [Candidatus Woesearchaeota archaeon]|jgi:proteasome beta subunit|nr:proteasome subunit beta [Candidatus Woesearchaeota archaeon]MDP6265146.1 proteasome subunit beta [Candidatus Woesearchaeota archaeon]MDP7476389.1 proteasome subunit beta [Candidatus Woesearchaeota archaeon]HJO01738.1 proteasome subunit beta [Candidatus Woesearchaeota archaeon]|tara:strand:- start:2479 stop:3123 length:645 start_codon:yes stop_codon:yes gene_type:complete